MSIYRWMDKKDLVYMHNENSVIKRNEIMSWMDIEIIILSEVSQSEKDKYHMISFICKIKKKEKDTNELISKTETCRPRKQTYSYWWEKGYRGGINYELGINIYILVYRKQINKDPLHSIVEKERATYSSILAWRIPWTDEPGRLQSMGSEESDKT